ncbi:MAG TPA: NAD-dependent epimerase/dehydratase family protein [Rudaea sp.]|nr:NAD-dependent epimerase/dehydratase family protein [Rudaea sp.]
MPTILVFGASGAIGHFALPLFVPDHHILPVSRAVRAGWIVADLNDSTATWPDAEIVLSLGPLDAFANWLERTPATALRRVIAISSMSAQTKQDSPDPAERALALRLREAEAHVHDAAAARGIDCTILRPTLIYGAGIDRTLAPLARFARRWRVLPIPFAASGLRQPVHAADLAAACAAVIANSATFGKTYEIGGGERLRFDAMIRRLRECARGFALPLPIPILALRLLARPARIASGTLARLHVDLIADNAPAIRDFDYSPRSFHADEVLPGRNRV